MSKTNFNCYDLLVTISVSKRLHLVQKYTPPTIWMINKAFSWALSLCNNCKTLQISFGMSFPFHFLDLIEWSSSG